MSIFSIVCWVVVGAVYGIIGCASLLFLAVGNTIYVPADENGRMSGNSILLVSIFWPLFWLVLLPLAYIIDRLRRSP